jgi:hypothetical protein
MVLRYVYHAIFLLVLCCFVFIICLEIGYLRSTVHPLTLSYIYNVM